METTTNSTIRNAYLKRIQDENRRLNFAEKRLLLDLEEMEEKVDPTLGISASPISPEELYIWHANIRGPEGSPYEDAILHLLIEFPKDYPNQGPKISQMSKFTSPFFDR